jgi:hypothetical protein
MRNLEVQYSEMHAISRGVDENNPSAKNNTNSPTRSYPVSTEPLEQRRLFTDNIQERVPEKDEDFSFQKLRGRAVEMEKKTMGSVMRTPTKQSLVDSLKKQEDFSFQVLREKALKLETRSHANEVKLEDSSAKKDNITRSQGEKMDTQTADKKRSEPSSSPQPKKSDRNANGKESAYTPNRLNKYYKQRIDKEEVKATDMSHASVKKLSQWLADKPFETHKKPVVARKGAHIVTKARVFEKDYTVTVMEEMNKQYFPAGKVSEGKQWLEKAFKNVEESDESKSEELEPCSVSDKAKIFENAFKSKRRSTMGVDTRALYGET